MPKLTEIADRVWVARHEHLDVNATLVGGSAGLLVVDTLWSVPALRALLDGAGPLDRVVAAVNTHAHFDHVLGNAVVSSAGVPVHAHEDAVTAIAAEVPDAVPPTHPFSSAAVVDLGDRVVEVAFLGRGHTAGDVVVRVPDADVVLAGDLVEESAPPAYGPDSFPLEWPATLDLLLGMTTSSTVVVPGHGTPVDRAFVQEQRADIGVVAETIADLAGRGVPAPAALGAAQWPFPAEALTDAVSRGFEQLPRTARRLPLL